MFTPFSNPRLVAIACSLALLITPWSLKAAVLNGSGTNLPLPSVNPPWPPGVALTRTTVTGGFNGTWISPADANWIGTFNATGPIPSNTNGVTLYDFSGLPTGKLPAGTFFLFGDVDGGSQTNETFDLTATVGTGSGPFVTLTEWLDDTFAVGGTGTGTAGAIVAGNMPGWDWNVTTTGAYRIDGATVTGGNPSAGFALVSNQAISRLRLVKGSNFNSFSLRAPLVPEPATCLLMGIGLGAVSLSRKRQH